MSGKTKNQGGGYGLLYPLPLKPPLLTSYSGPYTALEKVPLGLYGSKLIRKKFEALDSTDHSCKGSSKF